MLGIYTRISGNKEDGKDTSIEIQTELGIAFAKSIGSTYKLYSDIGISGAKDEIEDRPEFAQLLDDIKKEIINGVWVLDQSRFERSPSVWQLFQLIANEKVIKYFPNSIETDLSDPMIQFSTGVLSLVNRLYTQLTRQKVNLTFDKRASQGFTHGITPYGYEKGADGKFVINEEEAEVIKKIFNLSLEGNGTYTIANILNDEGIKTKYNKIKNNKKGIKRKDAYTGAVRTYDKNKVKWRGNVIYDMLTNTTYKGIRTWNNPKKKSNSLDNIPSKKQLIKIDVPQIISPDLWDKVNTNLVINKKNVGKRCEYNYLLNGLVICGCCGKEYRGKKRVSKKDSAYKCVAIGNCKESRGISIIRFENFIIKHLFLSKNFKELVKKLPDNNTQLNSQKTQLQKNEELLKKKSKLKIKYLEWLEDEIASSDEDLLSKFNNVIKDIDNLKNRISLLKQLIVDSENSKIKFEKAINEFDLTIGFDNTKKIIHSLIERITVKHNKVERGGLFLIEIKYKGLEEVSIFTTNWSANKWYWQYYYRSKSTNDEQLNQDKEDLIALYEYKGIELTENEIQSELKNFEGFEQTVKMNEVIELDNDNLLIFN